MVESWLVFKLVFELFLELISPVNTVNEYVVFSPMRLPHKHVYIHMKGEEGGAKLYAMHTGGLQISVLMQKRHILHVLCNIFICNVLLPYFAVFDGYFHYCLIKHLLKGGVRWARVRTQREGES